MTGFFKFPIFMSRKKKRIILETMIGEITKADKKKRCDICKRRFTKKMSRWRKDDFTSCICILCHKSYWYEKMKDYNHSEQKEIRGLKGNE